MHFTNLIDSNVLKGQHPYYLFYTGTIMRNGIWSSFQLFSWLKYCDVRYNFVCFSGGRGGRQTGPLGRGEARRPQ